MARIPLIEINNSILLKFASEADSKGNNNAILDTDEEISIFKTKAEMAIRIGLCKQNDYDDVMQIDSKKITTQVTTMEDVRNLWLEESPTKKDYDVEYYEQMKERFKNDIEKFEKELIKVKKDLENAQQEFENSKKDIAARVKHEQSMRTGYYAFGYTAASFYLFANVMSVPIGVLVGIPSILFMLTFGSYMKERHPEIMMRNDPEYLKLKANCDNLNTMIDDVQKLINYTKENFDTIVNQKDFLEKMDNYIKIVDQRESFLNKFEVNN